MYHFSYLIFPLELIDCDQHNLSQHKLIQHNTSTGSRSLLSSYQLEESLGADYQKNIQMLSSW